MTPIENQLRKKEFLTVKHYGNEASYWGKERLTGRERKCFTPFSSGTGENDADRISAEDVSVLENTRHKFKQYSDELHGLRIQGDKFNEEHPVLSGEFGNNTGNIGMDISRKTKSMFNKEKWLPAARDLPFKISNYCCMKMKKHPMHKYGSDSKRYPIIGTLAEESRIREQAWIRHGCNAFDCKKASSQPLSFWTNQDILHYLKQNNIQIAQPYGDIVWTDPDGNDCNYSMDFFADMHCTGCQRTGCVYCCFGAHHSDDTRFIELARIAPRQFEYAFSGGQWIDNPDYDPFAPEYDGEWKNWNPKKIWVPSKDGLGLKFVIDEFNKLYPNNKIKY